MAKRAKPAESTEYAEKHWTLDKRVPISLIITLALQAAGFMYWMGGVTRDVAELKKTVEQQTIKLERVSALDVEIKNLKEAVVALNRNVERVVDRMTFLPSPKARPNG